MNRARAARQKRIDEHEAWKRAEAMKNADITDRRCAQCGLPCPKYRKTCRACGYKMGRE
jgi:hypothetical protein